MKSFALNSRSRTATRILHDSKFERVKLLQLQSRLHLSSSSSKASEVYVNNTIESSIGIAAAVKEEDYFDNTQLPRHGTSKEVNEILANTEVLLQSIHKEASLSMEDDPERLIGPNNERVYSNSYVDLGSVDTIGFDYDYTLVTYTEKLLEVIYNMALELLVNEYQYPKEMLTDKNMQFDSKFSIRGLAIDRENGWICHLTYTHKVGVAWEGRNKVSREQLMSEYSGKRSLSPHEREKRLRPINDLFSLPVSCLVADVIQWLKDNDIPYCARSAVTDILGSIDKAHSSGDFHRLVSIQPEIYFEPQPYLKQVIESFKHSGKRLIFASNSPFWYVDAGMKYFLGDDWRSLWDVIIVSAGKPAFYTETNRPFREVSQTTGRVKFKQIHTFEPGEVYTGGCLRELANCIFDYNSDNIDNTNENKKKKELNDMQKDEFLKSPNVLYIGDSLFADLVDAKREFGWTTATVTPEIGDEIEIQSSVTYMAATKTINVIVDLLRSIQAELGTSSRSADDAALLDKLERMLSKWRDEQSRLLGNPFGSIFRARHQPSLFAHSIRRYCDLYMSDIGCLRHYSPQHRFYPDECRLLSHEIN